MQIDVIIIGQGISGTFLSYYLQKKSLSFILIDESRPNTASKAAAGMINPVTGRRMVKTWMIDELMTFSKNAYQQIGDELNMECMTERKIIDFFPTPQMRNAFIDRFNEDADYLDLPASENEWRENFNYEFGFGEIAPIFLVDINGLLSSFREKLIADGQLMEEKFDINELHTIENKIQYKNISSDKIIFCDGINGVDNPYFKNLPFAPNKGEALIVEIKEFPSSHIFKKGINIVPLKKNLFWIGSSYEWDFKDEQHSENFRMQTESVLHQWLKMPFNIVDHVASVRPATLERRPFVGFHPAHQNIGILNGMGTKGCSLAPYFAKQLVENMINNSIILPEGNVQRFNKILLRS